MMFVSMPDPLMFLPISSISKKWGLLERQSRQPLLGEHEQFASRGLQTRAQPAALIFAV